MTDNRRISLEARLIRKWSERDALASKLAEMDRANRVLEREVALGLGYILGAASREKLEAAFERDRRELAKRGEGRA